MQTADTDKIESADGGLVASIERILKLLARPELRKWRPVMVIAILLTLGAAVLEVVGPILVGIAVNQLVANDQGIVAGFGAAATWIAIATSVQFTARAMPQLRDWLFSPVSQDA